MSREIGTVGVVGLGTMGAGIAEVLARRGLDVVAVEADADRVEHGRGLVERSTSRAVTRGRLAEEDRQALLGRVRFTAALDALAAAELVVEAVPERLDVKREIFAHLDSVVAPTAILATNTSSLSVTEIAGATRQPGRVLGMHFFNPAPVQRLVEVVRTVVTESAAVDDVVALARRLGKRPVVVGDRAGFIANALLFGYLNHAVRMYEQGHVGRDDLDAAMTLGCGLPMGPLALLDLIGLDTAVQILQTMHEQSRDRLHAPAPLLTQMMAAGLLGRKSGRGFHEYASPGSSTVAAGNGPGPARAPSGPGRQVRVVGVVGTEPAAMRLAQDVAVAGHDVVLVGNDAEEVVLVIERIRRSLDKDVQAGVLADADRIEAFERIGGTFRLEDLADADLVVAAVEGEPAVVRGLFAELGRVCRPGAVLASGGRSPVIDCAAASGRPGDVVGMHVVDAPAGARLVEVASTVATSADAVEVALSLCERLGVRAVLCGDRAGFVVDALLYPYLNDAVRMLSEGYATADDIDTAMTAGCGYPQGPFEVLDAVGLDVALATQRALYAESREPGHAPAPLLEQLVTAGFLGVRTARGFRMYA
jgi:3-hydroxybutyryl-CoA dehydrogenase